MPRPRTKLAAQSDMMRSLGVDTLRRIDPDEDFSDVDGDPRNDFALVNEEADRNYCWVRNHPDDVGEYKGGIVPYRVEHRSKDGVDLKMSADGPVMDEPITKRGHVLMSCDKALWQKRNRWALRKTSEHNEAMFKRRQRDLDLRRPGALEDEAADMRG